MIVYNITIKVDLDIHAAWLQWMKLEHIPAVMGTGYFNDHRMMRIMEQDETDGITYAIQFHAKDMSDYFSYQQEQAPALQRESAQRFGMKAMAFRTVMKLV